MYCNLLFHYHLFFEKKTYNLFSFLRKIDNFTVYFTYWKLHLKQNIN